MGNNWEKGEEVGEEKNIMKDLINKLIEETDVWINEEDDETARWRGQRKK